ncbi:tRNA (guanosine(46)-N7)-methyltransferase TrmB [Candidatus Poribacteria bacterium]|nr:tRNA (guanosine(46)-N7)-methyltransferase TrmB [Candidatus Poribacteria bacterium]MYK20186.1 tRNA (guanosine(46)-N7)-methyltransferase TrmB [Candidatus Poribacteria bacterium]
MRENPDYNDIYYQNTTAHSQIIDIVTERIIPLSEVAAPIDWEVLFGNSHPVEIEIGFGKGRFLLEASKRHPKVNYIGVERAQKYVGLTRERFEKYMRHFEVDRASGTFSNVRLVWTDANYFLTRYVPAVSVQAYHIYFPDPWPKKRQRKRRIFRNQDFLYALTNTLQSDGGRLYIATDYAAYFWEIQETLSQVNALCPIAENLGPDRDITTNFEMKYTLEGREIYRTVYEKS